MFIFIQFYQVNMDELNSLVLYLSVFLGKFVLDVKEQVIGCYFDYEVMMFNMGNIIKINILRFKQFFIGSMVSMLKFS